MAGLRSSTTAREPLASRSDPIFANLIPLIATPRFGATFGLPDHQANAWAEKMKPVFETVQPIRRAGEIVRELSPRAGTQVSRRTTGRRRKSPDRAFLSGNDSSPDRLGSPCSKNSLALGNDDFSHPSYRCARFYRSVLAVRKQNAAPFAVRRRSPESRHGRVSGEE